MKINLRNTLPSWLVGWCLSAALLPTLVAANTTNSAPKGANATQQTNSQPERIVIPESDFEIPASVADGRDPFFPDSQRNRKVVATNKTPVAAPVSLVLQGISGTDTKRFALISGRTFVVGEEADVNSGNSRVRVLCVAIDEDSATIEANGQRQILRLRRGL